MKKFKNKDLNASAVISIRDEEAKILTCLQRNLVDALLEQEPNFILDKHNRKVLEKTIKEASKGGRNVVLKTKPRDGILDVDIVCMDSANYNQEEMKEDLIAYARDLVSDHLNVA